MVVADELEVRAYSAFYSRRIIRAYRRAWARFSVTIRVDKKVRRTIEAIPVDAWVEIEYLCPVWDDEQRRFVFGRRSPRSATGRLRTLQTPGCG